VAVRRGLNGLTFSDTNATTLIATLFGVYLLAASTYIGSFENM
jgi:hypothetical protein